jgi:hypothetical protein
MMNDGELLDVGLLAPHPVAFSTSADITPHAVKTEPYAITNKGLRIRLRLLEHNLPRVPHTHFAILQCSYTNNLSTAIAIPIAQMSTSKFSGSEDDFYHTPNQGFIEVRYSQAAPLENRNVYFLTARPLFLSQDLNAYHRCWLRDYDHLRELGIRFHKARYREYPITTRPPGDASYTWNYKSKSMSWAKAWRGSRAALYFSKKDGPAFVVILTFTYLSDQGGQIGMDIHIKSVMSYTKEPISKRQQKVVLDQILVEVLPYDQGFQLAEAQKTLPFEDQLMTIRVKEEMVFDEDMFILGFSFSGVKRGSPDTILESPQKRAKQSKSIDGEVRRRGKLQRS